ncbi:MAG: stage 0 sporulation protein [Chloroflexi bacterium]|nr:stage 0 sporulation protein [Chloroflexota bacterium]
MSRRKQFDFGLEQVSVIPSPVREEILRKTQDDGVSPLAGAKLIARERLRPDPDQPRHHFDPANLQALAASLLADGMQSPITAYYDDDADMFTIVTGERRWRASAIAGLERLPVLVTPRPDHPADTLGRQLAENLLRADLTELEKAQALARMRDLQPQTWVELARRHGLSDRRLFQMLSLLDAPQPLQTAIQEGRISGRHARAIARLPEDQHIEMLTRVVGNQLSARDTEELVRSLIPSPSPEDEPSEPADDDPDSPPQLGPTAGAVAAVLDAPLQQARRRQVRRFATRVDAMETQLRNLRVGELLPGVPELPEYVQRMRRLREALDEYIGFLERIQLDAPGEMDQIRQD